MRRNYTNQENFIGSKIKLFELFCFTHTFIVRGLEGTGTTQ